MQTLQIRTSDEPSHQLISARRIFSVRPTDPPSSPPPTSPLPPLPEIAHYRPARSASSVNPVPAFGQPRRPPRPSVSLSDLKPRTIQSPEIAKRQRSVEVAAQTRACPLPVIHQTKECATKSSITGPQKRSSIRLLTTSPDSSSNFSDDVLAALPKLFQRSSPTSSRGDLALRTVTSTSDEDDRIRAWQVYHGIVTDTSIRQKGSRKETLKPIARSALFVPNRAFPTRRDSLQHQTMSPQSCQFKTISTDASPSKRALFSPFHSPKRKNHDDRSTPYMNLGALSVDTNVASSFNHATLIPSYTSQISTGNLTSIPQLPSTRSLARVNHLSPLIETQGGSQHGGHIRQAKEKPTSPSEEAAFISLPYSQTVTQARLPLESNQTTDGSYHPASNTGLIDSQLIRTTSATHEMDDPEEEGARVLTEEELKRKRRKRLLWALSTIALVLLATAGILGGVIWKLNNL